MSCGRSPSCFLASLSLFFISLESKRGYSTSGNFWDPERKNVYRAAFGQERCPRILTWRLIEYNVSETSLSLFLSPLSSMDYDTISPISSYSLTSVIFTIWKAPVSACPLT